MADSELLEEVQRLWKGASNPDRLYSLRSHVGYGFYTGRLLDGRQSIVFLDRSDDAVLLIFTSEGVYQGHERRRIKPLPTPEKDLRTPEPVHNHCAEAFGFVPGVIRVRAFHDADWLIAVEPLAGHLQDFVQDPVGFSEGDVEEIQDLTDTLREWIQEGEFVFCFNNEYWMDRNGYVQCS